MKAEGRTIGDLIEPRREKAVPSEHPDLPYIGLEHIEAHSTRLLGFVPATQMRSTAKRFYSGDVLYSRLRPYLNKVWRADRDGLCSSEFIVMPGNDEIDSNFLRYRLNSSDFVRFANSLNAGDRPRVDFDQISSFALPTFSLPAQRAAVAEIEKQFTRLEAGVTALRRVQAKLKRYRAAVLKAACEGRLVPTEAELTKTGSRKTKFESSEALLARILIARRKNWQGRGQYKEPGAADTTNLPPLPKGWTWATLDALAGIKGGITKDQNRKHTAPARLVPYLRVANVQRGYLDLNEVKEIVTTEEEIRELALKPGDILFNEGGDRDKLGRGWVWNDQLPECIHQNHVFRARRFDAALNPKLVSWYANTFGQQFFFDEGKHTTNLASISMTKLRGLPVPIAPPAEQTRIVAEVERRLSVVEELEAVVSVNLQRATRLRQSILARAFSDGFNRE
jgi:type I restriction enzyme S subunit